MNERQKSIVELLSLQHTATVHDLSKKFNVSDETIRRDLKFLESRSFLERRHGKAVFNATRIKELLYEERARENFNLKKEAASPAESLITDGDSIAIANGTSTLQVAKAIKNKNDLTIITNSLVIAGEMVENETNQVIIIGGRLRKEGMGSSGSHSIEFLSNFRVDYGIISAGGISLEAGVTDFAIEEAQLFKKILSIAKYKIVVVDSTKLGKSGLAKICDVRDVDMILSDGNLQPKLIKQYENEGVKILTPNKK